jgi:hypothetical protein
MAAGGSRTFKAVQYGKESTKGTAVAATKIFLGEANVPKDRTPSFPEYNLGVRARSNDVMFYQYLADGITLSCADAYYQMLPLFFSIGLKGNVTASETTPSKTDYAWAFTPSLTATNSQDAITLEVGDDQQFFEIEYLMAKRLMFRGAVGGNSGMSAEAECFGRQVTKTTKTGALTLPTTVDQVNPNTFQLFYDPSWAAKGSTEKTQVLRDFEVEIVTGLHPKFLGNSTTFSVHGESYIDVTVRCTFEGNATAVAFFDDFQAGTPKLLELKSTGPITVAGGTAQYVKFDVWGAWEEIIPLASEADGNNLYTGVFHGLYDITGAKMLDVNVVTSVNAI